MVLDTSSFKTCFVGSFAETGGIVTYSLILISIVQQRILSVTNNGNPRYRTRHRRFTIAIVTLLRERRFTKEEVLTWCRHPDG